MARPAEVSDADIIAAGERILASSPKARVTGYSLRKMLESGDPVRLEGVWKAHVQAQTPAAPDPAPVTPLPPTLQEQRDSASAQLSDVVTRLFAAAWSTADDIAQRRVADEQIAAREKVADAEQRLADADDVIRAADTRAEAQSERADGLEQQLAAAKDEALRAQERYIALEALQRDLTRRLAEADAGSHRAREDAAAARATADAAKADAERERESLARLGADLNALRAEKTNTDIALSTAQTRVTDLESEIKTLTCDAGELRTLNATLSTKLAISESQVTTLTADLNRSRESNLDAEKKLEELKAAKSEIATRLAIAEARGVDLESDLARERNLKATAEKKLADALDRASRAEERSIVNGMRVPLEANPPIS